MTILDVEERETDSLPEGLDDENRLKSSFVSRVVASLDDGVDDSTYDLVGTLHPADIADLFELVESDVRAPLAAAITDLLGADVLAELNDYVREDIIDFLPAGLVAELAGQMETDDAVAIIEDLEVSDQQAVLAELAPEDRAAIEDALSYPEETAGRLMQRDLVAVPEHMTVGHLIDYLREHSDLTTEFWEVFIVDAAHHPVGTCQLSWILRTPRDISLGDVMKRWRCVSRNMRLSLRLLLMLLGVWSGRLRSMTLSILFRKRQAKIYCVSLAQAKAILTSLFVTVIKVVCAG